MLPPLETIQNAGSAILIAGTASLVVGSVCYCWSELNTPDCPRGGDHHARPHRFLHHGRFRSCSRCKFSQERRWGVWFPIRPDDAKK